MGLRNVHGYLNEKQAEGQLSKFLKDNEKDIGLLMKDYARLFNDCGKKTGSEPVQVGFFSAIILLLSKNSGIPKSQVLQAFKNIERKL